MVATSLLLADAAEQLAALLDLSECFFEPFPFDVQLPRIEPGRIVLPAAEPGVAPWSLDAGVELPVRFDVLTVGRFVLVPGQPTAGVTFPPAARAVAIEIAQRMGAPVAAALRDGSDLTGAGSAGSRVRSPLRAAARRA